MKGSSKAFRICRIRQTGDTIISENGQSEGKVNGGGNWGIKANSGKSSKENQEQKEPGRGKCGWGGKSFLKKTPKEKETSPPEPEKIARSSGGLSPVRFRKAKKKTEENGSPEGASIDGDISFQQWKLRNEGI